MRLDFLTTIPAGQESVLLYLSQYSLDRNIRGDVIHALTHMDINIKPSIFESILDNLIDNSKNEELSKIFDMLAIKNVMPDSNLMKLLHKDTYQTACFIKDHAARSSPMMTLLVRYLTEQLITNILDHSEIIYHQEDMVYLENIRDIWLELLARHRSDTTMVNSTYIQLLSGFIGLKNNCQQQCYLVDLLAKTVYGTHYNMDKYPDLDSHFLSAITDIATSLSLSNKSIIQYLHLNPSHNWLELYIAAKDFSNPNTEKLIDLKDLSLTL